ncbi:MAG: 4Fe-4S binding protein [Pygmaiobacter massiliensis]|nr:4Fe-4S binding protein [Pygmaiobacter massiliensis]
MNPIKKRRKAIIDQSNCVACGCCEKICPLQAIVVVGGIMAKVNPEKCVGCGKCAKKCPASIIHIQEVEA